MMDLNKLPNGLKSIFISMNEELHEEYKNMLENKKKQDFISSVVALMTYYISSVHQIAWKEYPKEKDKLYINRIDEFQNDFTNALYAFELTDDLYDNLFTCVVNHMIQSYWEVLALYAKRKHLPVILIPNEDACDFCIGLSNFIKSPDEFLQIKEQLHPQELAVVVPEKTTSFKISDIEFIDVPVYLKNQLMQLIFYLSNKKRNNFITKKKFIFLTELREDFMSEDAFYINSYSLVKDILCQVIYTLLKDKLLKEDLFFWKDRYATICKEKYVADNCYLYKHKFFTINAERNAEEYFISCVQAYLLDEIWLQTFDLEAFNQIKRLLEREV